MKRYLILLWLPAAVAGYSQKAGEITAKELKEYVCSLASDSLKGRKPGTPEAHVAANYILEHFRSAGLKPMCDSGFQYFDVITDATVGEHCSLSFPGFTGTVQKDFIPVSFSSDGQAEGPVVFAGYGFMIDADSLKWNDYDDLDVKGAWVMIFRSDPGLDNNENKYIRYSDLRSKVLTAKDQGAAGVLVVTTRGYEKDDKLIPLTVENNDVTAGIPVISITREVADKILARAAYTVDSLESLIGRKMKPVSFGTGVILDASSEVILKKQRTENVVALLEGSDPVLKNEYLVIGAHYDHLGFGGPNSGSRMTDTVAIHNGADDNASGTALVMALAQNLSADRASLKRSILFVSFSAEEMGLIGSRYFVDHPPVSLKSIKAMFNFDMVGRYDKDRRSISISGTGTSLEADSILKVCEKGLPFEVVHSPDGYGPSDHASFYADSIPVFFFTTGVHMDYHTPFDDADKLDYSTEKTIGDFASVLVKDIDDMSHDLTFRESGSRQPYARTGRKLKVTLGIMPDFAGTEKRGLRVDGVTKDGPADRGGMKKGDIITSLDGMSVGNIYEYMARLGKLKHGQTISVEVLRDGRNQVLIVLL